MNLGLILRPTVVAVSRLWFGVEMTSLFPSILPDKEVGEISDSYEQDTENESDETTE